MKARQTDFSQGKVSRNILSVAVPMTVAQLLNLLYNIVDRMFIGRIPEVGTLALTGVGLCFPLITMISAFTLLFGSGGSPLCAMARGRGDEKEAGLLMGNTFAMLLITAAVLMLVGYLFHRPILYAFGASDMTFPFAGVYIRIYLAGTVFVMITLGMNPFINSQGFARIGMLTVLLGAVCNTILDPVFIFVFHLGVAGAALATILSQALSALWVMRFLTGSEAELKLTRASMRLSAARVLSIVRLGMSGFFMAFTNSLSQIACNVNLQHYGGDLYVGIMTVLNSVREIFTMPVTGLTNGASPVLSFNYGEGAYHKVLEGIRFVTIACILFTLAAWGVLWIFPEFFIRLFNSDPELIEAGVPALHTFFFGFVFMALQFAAQSTFVALGKSGRATFFSLFRKVVIVVPLTFLLPRLWNLGVNGVFWAEPISNLIGGCASFFTMLLTVVPELRRGKGGTNGRNSGMR